MKKGALLRAVLSASAALVIQAHAQETQEPAKPPASAPLPPILRQNLPVVLLPSSGVNAPPSEITPLNKEPDHQPLPSEHDPNWLLKGVQAEQKTAAKNAVALTNSVSLTLPSSTSTNAIAGSLDAPKQDADSPTQSQKEDLKPVLSGISADAAKPLQGQDKILNAKKPMPTLGSINPDLIKPIDLNTINTPALNPDLTTPAFENQAMLTSTAIKVPDSTGIANSDAPIPGAFNPEAPTAPQAPTPKGLPIAGGWKPTPIAPPPKPILIPSIAAPTAPTLPSLPTAPRLPDPNDESPLRH